MAKRVILDFSLSELNARRFLRQSVRNDNDVDNKSITMRRAYLNKIERDTAAQLPEAALKEYFQPGEFIHVPMTEEERFVIDQYKKFNKKKLSKELDQENFQLLTELLPGRRIEDVRNYLDDLSNGNLNDTILVFTGEALDKMNFLGKSQKIKSDWTQFLKKQFSIFESSGSITQIACRTGSQNPRVMIGACATQEDRYNRVGEILLAYREPEPYDLIGTDSNSNLNYDVLILDGHKKAKSTSNGSVVMRQTVTCVVYDPLTDLFFSGGYDGDVVAWSASKAIAIDTVGSHPKPINSIACHSSKKLVAYGCQNGSLFYANLSFDEDKMNYRPIPLFSKPKAKDSFSNTIDHVAMPSTGIKSNSCYAGIGYLQASNSGIIEEWDLETGIHVSSSERLTDGLACMSISSCGTMLVAGTGGISSDDVKGDGIVRVFDLNQNLKTSIEIKTINHDLDCVSFCPQSKLLFMGETSDSSVSVYDLRFPIEPLFTTSHGTTAVDSVVAHTWLSNGSVLVTGGHDGSVKLWDCRRVDHSLWVGADNGGVYMLSSPGALGENHPPILSGKCVF